MKNSTAQGIAWALKLGFAAVFSAMVIGNIAGALIGVIFAYTLIVSYPRPFKTFKESLRVNWRGFFLVGGLIGAGLFAILDHGQIGAEAKVICLGFQGAFLGVIFGEIFAKIPLSMVKDKN